uniref:Putative secreted protein n=1 Tax=Anopheles marajoara TaxID=58244 RepID=A0A2M4CAY4_9DIPT
MMKLSSLLAGSSGSDSLAGGAVTLAFGAGDGSCFFSFVSRGAAGSSNGAGEGIAGAGDAGVGTEDGGTGSAGFGTSLGLGTSTAG